MSSLNKILFLMVALSVFSSQLLGVFPYRLNYRNFLFRSTWYMRVYSLLMFAVALMCCISNYTVSLMTEKEWKQSETFATANQVFTLIMATVIVITFVAQQFNHRHIAHIFPQAIRLLAEANKINDQLKYGPKIIGFAVKCTVIDVAIIISATNYGSSSPEQHRWQTYFYAIVPHLMIAIIPNFYLASMNVCCHYFMVINKRMERIMGASEVLIDSFACASGTKPADGGGGAVTMLSEHKVHVRMKRFCELSDEIDNIAILHLELCSVTKSVSRLWSIQLLAWTVYSVITFIVKLFKHYITIASTINSVVTTESQFDAHRFLHDMISLMATFFGLLFLANISAKTMKEVLYICRRS